MQIMRHSRGHRAIRKVRQLCGNKHKLQFTDKTKSKVQCAKIRCFTAFTTLHRSPKMCYACFSVDTHSLNWEFHQVCRDCARFQTIYCTQLTFSKWGQIKIIKSNCENESIVLFPSHSTITKLDSYVRSCNWERFYFCLGELKLGIRARMRYVEPEIKSKALFRTKNISEHLSFVNLS